MTSSSAARADGEAFLLHTVDGIGGVDRMDEARRVVTALVEALRDNGPTMLLECDACGAVVHESVNSRSESDPCGIGYAPSNSPEQFYRCEGRLRPIDALNGEARPALTVERLAELLNEMRGSLGRNGLTAREEAAYLLPRLAGPAQEGPHV